MSTASAPKARRAPSAGRLRRRLARHHLPLALLSAALIAIMDRFLQSDDPIWRLSMATAYVSLGLLAVTLVIGPLNVLRRRPNPVSTDLRRDVGIWAGLVGIAHMLVGLQVHLRGTPMRYFTYRPKDSSLSNIRFDAFGLANHTGLIATLILALLLALSNDLALRRLRTRIWKTLQRLNYFLLLFVALHGVLYQQIEKRAQPYMILFGAAITVVVLIQLSGLVLKLRQARAD
jgi:sulfoxide reductase heme-binding subunit YedZ